jgi:hypothetical protein
MRGCNYNKAIEIIKMPDKYKCASITTWLIEKLITRSKRCIIDMFLPPVNPNKIL